MAYIMEKLERCSSCGTKKDEWDESKGGHRHAYKAETWICHGCEASEAKYAAASENMRESKVDPYGLKVHLVPNKTVVRKVGL